MEWIITYFPTIALHFAGVLAVITYLGQMGAPAPYGKFDNKEAKGWGPYVPQRISHTLSDGLTCFVFVIWYYIQYGPGLTSPNMILLGMWLAHYLHRGLLHPWVCIPPFLSLITR